MKTILLYMTTKNTAQARRIGKTLVAERLVACVNILGGMNSIYRWEGKLCDEREAVLLAKTRDTLLRKVVNRVKQLHSYEVPCIVALPLSGGNRDFLRWVARETTP